MRLHRLNLVAAFFVFVGCAAGREASSAERKIAAARQVIAKDANSLQAYNDLAAALCERADETGKSESFGLAENALKNSFRIAPDDYTARKIQVTVLLGESNWVAAEEAAYRLNYQAPDDVAVWGLVAETNLALGNYAEAQKAAQWMFDLRPGNAAAFIPGAKVREAFGDVEGAIDFANEALRRLPENEREQRAIAMTNLARLYFVNGEAKRGGVLLANALELFPEYPEALKQLAHVKDVEQKPAIALTIARQDRSVRHDIGTLDALAWALFRNGKYAEAKAEMDLALATGTKESRVLSHAKQIAAAMQKH